MNNITIAILITICVPLIIYTTGIVVQILFMGEKLEDIKYMDFWLTLLIGFVILLVMVTIFSVTLSILEDNQKQEITTEQDSPKPLRLEKY